MNKLIIQQQETMNIMNERGETCKKVWARPLMKSIRQLMTHKNEKQKKRRAIS